MYAIHADCMDGSNIPTVWSTHRYVILKMEQRARNWISFSGGGGGGGSAQIVGNKTKTENVVITYQVMG